MLTETEQLCEMWEEEHAAPFVHSRLFPLPSVGVGGSLVESLTSYIMRLADAHSVHPYTLIYKELAPLLNRPFLYQNGQLVGPFGQRSAALNGITPTAHLLAGVLEQLTLLRNLHFLTLLTYESVLSHRNLVRATQAWCPDCYQMWRREDQIIYTPLLWTFECVKICAIHDKYLHLHCPNPDCAHRQSSLTLQGRIGYCARCGQWLGNAFHEVEHVAVSEDEWMWQKWVTSTVGEMLAIAPSLATPLSRNGFASTITTLVIESNNSPLQLARQLHVHPMAVRQWRNGQKIPQLETLLRISAHSGISPLSLLTGNIQGPSLSRERVQLDVSSLPTQSKARRRTIDIEEVRAALEAALTEEPPRSRSRVARDLGFQPDNLAKLCPDLCRVIADRYREYQSKNRADGLKKRCEQVEQAVQFLYDQGRFPSKRQVQVTLNKPAIFRREAAVKAAWEGALKELGLI